MAKTLTSLRKSSLMPIMAVVSSFLLMTGQIFNCCRLNESISERIGKAALAASRWINLPAAEPSSQAVKPHLGCHGHPPSDASQAKAELSDPDDIHIHAKESCLSESGFASKSFSPSDGFQTALAFDTRSLVLEIPVPRLPCFEKPRPQNKSSPPLYLLTLQILV